MPRKKIRNLTLVLALAVTACVSETTTRGGIEPMGGRSTEREKPREEPQERPERTPASDEEKVRLPREVLNQLDAFVNHPRFLLADRIEIDVSRIPMQAKMVPVNDERYVETVELANPGQKSVGLVMRTRAKRPLVPRDRPRLRVGSGLELVAGKEILVRTHNRIDKNRPVFLHIRGIGHAVYADEETGKKVEKDAISIRAEIVKGRSGLVFRTRIL